MSSHIYHPEPRVGILVDECPRCEEHAERPLELGEEMLTALWQLMVRVERDPQIARPSYHSAADAKACRALYAVAVFLERHGGPGGVSIVVSPWTAFGAVDPRAVDRRERLQGSSGVPS